MSSAKKGTSTDQISIASVDRMPSLPQPLRIIDWKEKARAFDRLVFDFGRTGEHFPLIWIDRAHRNFREDTFGIPTVVGDPRMGPEVRDGEAHEAITCIAAVLGGLMVGIDKGDQDRRNYVAMCKNYFNAESGWDIVLDYTTPGVAGAGGGYGRSFWYDLYPNILFYCLASYRPHESDFDRIVHRSAEQWRDAARVLDGRYDYSSFDFGRMAPVDNGRWREPDAGAGIAWITYMAYTRFGDDSFLETAMETLSHLQRRERSPFYEVLLPYGVLAAARINAERGTSYDVHTMLDWCFTGESECRPGWGVIADRWGACDMHGLQGSVKDSRGYAFAMNTFDMVAALLPLPRYAPQYARCIAKWCLNAVNASRFFYPEELPGENQTCREFADIVENAIGYEGIRRYDMELLRSRNDEEARRRTPFAQGDSHRWGTGTGIAFPRISHLSLYGSSHVGMMGALVSPTDVEGILQIDCLASDYFHGPAYPSYLAYNPYPEPRRVSLRRADRASTASVRLYDSVSGAFVTAATADQSIVVELGADTAALLVEVPAGVPVAERNGHVYAGDTVIRYAVQ